MALQMRSRPSPVRCETVKIVGFEIVLHTSALFFVFLGVLTNDFTFTCLFSLFYPDVLSSDVYDSPSTVCGSHPTQQPKIHDLRGRRFLCRRLR